MAHAKRTSARCTRMCGEVGALPWYARAQHAHQHRWPFGSVGLGFEASRRAIVKVTRFGNRLGLNRVRSGCGLASMGPKQAATHAGERRSKHCSAHDERGGGGGALHRIRDTSASMTTEVSLIRCSRGGWRHKRLQDRKRRRCVQGAGRHAWDRNKWWYMRTNGTVSTALRAASGAAVCVWGVAAPLSLRWTLS